MGHASIVLAAALAASAVSRASAEPHSDGQLLAALKSINDGEISAASDAIASSTNRDVRDFAQHMIDDHTISNQKIDKLVASQRISIEEGMLSLKFRGAQAKNRTILSVMKGDRFDRTYVDQQAAGHQDVLSMLKEESGGSRAAAIAGLLSETTQTVSQHLDQAKAIQARLIR